MTEQLHYLSLGAGVQSSALYVLACQGAYENPPEVAIFADTQCEPQYVYDQLDRLDAWGDIPIHRVTHGALDVDMGAFPTIPAFTLGDDGKSAPLRRQCTREYKIQPVERKVRELMGLKKRQRVRRTGVCNLGISIDEQQRMAASRTRWVRNRWPLIELGLGRDACSRIVQEAGLPEPLKSSCVFCPYHSDGYWEWMRQEHPEEFERACLFDERIRALTKAGEKRPAYLHRSLRPLREIVFVDPRQGTFEWGCCESGHCGV